MNEQQRAEHAKRIIEDEVFKQAFNEVESGIIAAWRDAPIRDTQGQHELKLMLTCLQNTRKCLENTLISGKLAEIETSANNVASRKISGSKFY